VGALLGLAVLMRISAMFYHFVSGDDATVGLMAKHILSGENLPAFFYRQAYIGSFNGAHLVPTLFLFGPSVPFLPLNAIAWSLLFPLLLYVLGRRVFDETTARLTLLLAAVSPFCLTYWSSVLGHLETNTFGAILLLLVLPVLTGSTESRRTRLLGCLGGVVVAFPRRGPPAPHRHVLLRPWHARAVCGADPVRRSLHGRDRARGGRDHSCTPWCAAGAPRVGILAPLTTEIYRGARAITSLCVRGERT
jgi:hypothetical protein